MAEMSKESIKKLRAVKAAILAEPELYDQSKWIGTKENPCGTPCCIAGWAVWLNSPKKYKQLASQSHCSANAAESVLGINDSDRKLFIYWPKRFETALRKSTSAAESASICALRIEHYIATDGLQ